MQKPDLSKTELKLCLLRSLCVTAFVALAFVGVHIFDNSVWVTPLAATAFIAFAFPGAKSAHPRVLIGGYATACLWGVLAAVFTNMLGGAYGLTLGLCVLSLFLTTFTMTALDIEHPPAAALSVGIALYEESARMALAALVFVVFLSAVKMPLARLLLGEPKN